MVSVTAAVVQKARWVPVEASHDCVVHTNWVAAGAVAAQHSTVRDLHQMTCLASTHYLVVCVCVCQKSVVLCKQTEWRGLHVSVHRSLYLAEYNRMTASFSSV